MENTERPTLESSIGDKAAGNLPTGLGAKKGLCPDFVKQKEEKALRRGPKVYTVDAPPSMLLRNMAKASNNFILF